MHEAPHQHSPGDSTWDFTHRVLLATGIVLLAVCLLLVFWFAFRGVLLGFAGLLLAVFLYRLAALLRSWTSLPYGVSLTLVCLLLLGVALGSSWLAGARIATQTTRLREQLPEAWAKVRENLQQSPTGRWLLDRGKQGWDEMQAPLMRSGVGVLTSVSSAAAESFVVIFLGLFGAISPERYVRGMLRLVPLNARPRMRRVFDEIGDLIWWWLLGQLVSMAFLGVLTGLGIWFLGVPLALTLSLLAAVLNFVPNFGPILAAVPAFLLGLLVSPMTAFWVLVWYVGLQMLQNHLVTPVVQQKAVRLSPVSLMLAQIFFYYWGGLLGTALAPPLAAVLVRVIQMLYVQDVLHDPMRQTTGFWPDGAAAPPPRP